MAEAYEFFGNDYRQRVRQGMEAERRYAARHGRGFEYSQNYEQERKNFDRQRAQFHEQQRKAGVGSAATGSPTRRASCSASAPAARGASSRRRTTCCAAVHHPDSATTAGADFARLKDAYDEPLPHAEVILDKNFPTYVFGPPPALAHFPLARRVHHNELLLDGRRRLERDRDHAPPILPIVQRKFHVLHLAEFLITLRCFLPLGCDARSRRRPRRRRRANGAHAAAAGGRRFWRRAAPPPPRAAANPTPPRRAAARRPPAGRQAHRSASRARPRRAPRTRLHAARPARDGRTAHAGCS